MLADLRVEPIDIDSLRGILKLYRDKLGYKLVAMDVDVLERMGREEVLRIARDAGVNVVTRVTLKASTRREARLALEKAPKADLVVLEAGGVDAARYAGVNKKIHVVRVKRGMERIVDSSQARLFREKGFGAIEVSLRSALEGDWRYFSVLRRAYAYDIDVVLVSDARSPMEAWHPMHIKGLLKTIGVPPSAALTWLGSSPLRVLRVAGALR